MSLYLAFHTWKKSSGRVRRATGRPEGGSRRGRRELRLNHKSRACFVDRPPALFPNAMEESEALASLHSQAGRLRRWVAYTGLHARQHTSGTSVAKKPVLSKTGKAHLRRALYIPALVASRSMSPICAASTNTCWRTTKTKPQALVAVIMRKLRHAIFAMFKPNQPFEGFKIYSLDPALKLSHALDTQHSARTNKRESTTAQPHRICQFTRRALHDSPRMIPRSLYRIFLTTSLLLMNIMFHALLATLRLGWGLGVVGRETPLGNPASTTWKALPLAPLTTRSGSPTGATADVTVCGLDGLIRSR
jgi:Transposase IS116/IS110/IS902 family